MGPGSNASPEAQATRSAVNRSAQPRVLRKQSDPGPSLRPTRITGTGAACCAPGHSSGGGRRTPGGTMTWTWDEGSGVDGSATSRRAVRSHSGLRTPRVSPTAAVQPSSVASEVSQPAMASGCPVAAASSTWASVTERTDRFAATSGKRDGGPSGTAGWNAGRVAWGAAVAEEATGSGDEAGGEVSAWRPARPAPTAAASRTTGKARPIARRPRRMGPRGFLDAGWTIMVCHCVRPARRAGRLCRPAILREVLESPQSGKAAQRGWEPVDVGPGVRQGRPRPPPGSNRSPTTPRQMRGRGRLAQCPREFRGGRADARRSRPGRRPRPRPAAGPRSEAGGCPCRRDRRS